MFFCQVVATVIAGTVQLVYSLGYFPTLRVFAARSGRTASFVHRPLCLALASIIVRSLFTVFLLPPLLTSPMQWGVIGPSAFSSRQVRCTTASCSSSWPVLCYRLSSGYYTRSSTFGFLKYLNFPLIFVGTGNMPPATPLNYVPWVLICFLFNYVIRRRHFGWWSKYNCKPMASFSILDLS